MNGESVVREHSEQLGALFTALAAAQAEFTTIPKDATNPFFKSHYAALPTVVEKASPILTKHGLSVSQFPGTDADGQDTLTTWLGHKSGEWICESMRLHLVKQDPQGQGSAMTYARRYAYMAALGLVADEDDDGNAASRPAATVARIESATTPASNGERASAAPAKGTERPASAKQRGLIHARAAEASIPPYMLADILLAVAGQEPRNWDSPEQAEDWLTRQMDRLPARLVDPMLERIAAEKGQPEVIPF